MAKWRSQLNRLLSRFAREYKVLNRIEVSASALRYNVELVAKNTGLDIIPVLKSNAYGHGLELVVQALRGLDVPYIAVDGYFEALRIRNVSRQPVLVMGYIHPDNYQQLNFDGIAFVVHDAVAVQALGVTGKPVKIHLEVNTGMHRQGAAVAELEALLKLIGTYPSLELEGVMSHLADADNEVNDFTDQQAEVFRQSLTTIRSAGFSPRHIHLAQTAGSTKVSPEGYTAIRLGIGLYGINPLSKKDLQHKMLAGLKPAARMISTVARINEVQKGNRVSYNGIWTAPKAGRVAVLPVGYYEGLPRELSNKGVVKYGNVFLPIAGRVCMNHTMIDVGDALVKPLAEVIVISDDPKDPNSVAGWQREHGLFPYTSLTGLGPDVRRILVN